MADVFAQRPGFWPASPDPRRRLRLGLRLLVAVVSFVILIGSGFAWAAYKNFTSNIPRGAPVPQLAAGTTDIDGKDQNILLIGNDSRAGASAAELRALSTGNDGGSVNTDTMMVLHIPANGSRATVISFPRDSWVDIPGNGKGKINSAYGDGYSSAKNAGKNGRVAQSAGIIMMIKTISALTGLHIDHYMQVNLLGFYRISNAIGGVTVCLNAAQNPNTDSDAFGKGYSGINLPKGVSVIKGSQALAFVRQRHGLPNGDLDRIRRQQYFLAAAFRKVESAGVLLNPFKLHDLLNAVGSSLLTDPALNVLSLGREFAQMSAGNITFKTIPNNGPQLIYPDGVETSIVEVNKAALPDFIRQLQGKSADAALTAAKAAAPSSVTVDVLNGTSTAGRAGRNAVQLRGLGFKVNTVDSTDPATATVVEYPNGTEAQAKAVAAAVAGAKLVQTSSVPRVTLVLGANGVQVNGLAHATPSSASSGTTKSHAATSAATPVAALGCIN
ncbi:MAG: Transcriptional attenuator, LytR family [Pseudonocardiales bacterium]|nr:Transcriptional attenuator, LytR family [Pseudonocardiales bacterium]